MGDVFDLSRNIPEFLNKTFFEKILKDVKILDFLVGTASKPGDNFVGAVYRVTLGTENGTKQFVVKAPSTSGHETLHSYLSNDFVDDLFKCEIKMYEDVLPKVINLWNGAGYKERWCPQLIHQSASPHLVIVLEDLSPFGFTTTDKPPADFEASKMIAKRLAKFHAASYFLANEKHENFSNFNGTVYGNRILSRVIYNMGLDGFIHVASQKPTLRRYVDRLKVFSEQFESQIVDAYKPIEHGINVLCHNDFHIKNLLFKEGLEGKSEDFCAIDFQLCNFTSPAFDLIYALYYFVSAENRRCRREEFISTYYNQFVCSLCGFKFTKEVPSREKLNQEFHRCSAHEILTAICLTIFFYFDLKSLTAEELDMAEGTMKSKYRMFQNEEFLEMIEWQLKEFEERRIL